MFRTLSRDLLSEKRKDLRLAFVSHNSIVPLIATISVSSLVVGPLEERT